jgi:hypothetical protein
MLSMSGRGTGSAVWEGGCTASGACGFGVLMKEGAKGRRLVLSISTRSGEVLLSLASLGTKSFPRRMSCSC